MIFITADSKHQLSYLRILKKRIKSDGAIRVAFPKDQERIKLTDVVTAAKSVGLVDTKVVRFSETREALKLVVPLAKRK